MAGFATSVQAELTACYGLDEGPSIEDFIEPCDDGREELLVRDHDGDIEVMLVLPRRALDAGARATFDEICQVIEGVSHFLFLAERARRELPVTELELELQAEVDKYLYFTHAPALAGRAPRIVSRGEVSELHARLFERVTFLHPEGTKRGERYRTANKLAARYARGLEARLAEEPRIDRVRAALRRFYDAGQAEKIELARAA